VFSIANLLNIRIVKGYAAATKESIKTENRLTQTVDKNDSISKP